jgi:hypothetical protein
MKSAAGAQALAAYLSEEPYNLLVREFRTVNTYNAVIEVCSNGTSRVNEIAICVLLSDRILRLGKGKCRSGNGTAVNFGRAVFLRKERAATVQ